MSLRNRIVVVFVLLVFVVPVTGWAASQELNPDGRQLSAFGNESPVATPEMPTSPDRIIEATQEATVSNLPTAAATFFDRFLVWLQAMVQPL